MACTLDPSLCCFRAELYVLVASSCEQRCTERLCYCVIRSAVLVCQGSVCLARLKIDHSVDMCIVTARLAIILILVFLSLLLIAFYSGISFGNVFSRF